MSEVVPMLVYLISNIRNSNKEVGTKEAKDEEKTQQCHTNQSEGRVFVPSVWLHIVDLILIRKYKTNTDTVPQARTNTTELT